MDLETIIGSKVNTSAQFNSLFVPATGISKHVRNYSEPAIFHSNLDPPFDISKSGSLTKVQFSGQYFALSTFHQISRPHYNFEQFCIYNYVDRNYVTSSRAIFPDGDDDEREDFDCVLFDFTTSVNNLGLSSSGWYDLSYDLSRTSTPHPLAVCCVGYPGFRNSIDYENNHYGASPNAVWGRSCSPTLRGRLSFAPVEPLHFDPDGMSGSPVFGIALEAGGLTANLSGILTNASRTKFNFITLQRLQSLFSRAFVAELQV